MSDRAIAPHFLEGKKGRIFVLMRRPAAAFGVGVMIVPPFAEEMNKSRRMFTDVAQALATRGVATVIPDLYGTGDSEGEFREADCECWLDDLARAAAWSAEDGWPIAGLLCTRLGCILGARAARDVLGGVRRAVFWQPVIDGERFITQFLRLRVAASMMDEDHKESVGQLRERLRNGASLEVAGYELSARLASEIDSLRLSPEMGSHLGNLHWMEVVREAGAPLPAPSMRCIERCSADGMEVRVQRFVGDPFWASTEVVRIAALVGGTVEVLAGLRPVDVPCPNAGNLERCR